MNYIDNEINILLIDNDQHSLDMLEEYLQVEGYKLVIASNGRQALQLLKDKPERFWTILLSSVDDMGHIEILRQIKEHPILRAIPIIIQDSNKEEETAIESLKIGANYYIAKPYNIEKLKIIFQTSLATFEKYRRPYNDLKKLIVGAPLLQNATFYFKTLDDVNNISFIIANACPEPKKVIPGLIEILINAVEHGNLSISYKKKSKLLLDKSWDNEIAKRLEMVQYKNKYGILSFIRNEQDKEIKITITDMGEGFDWQKYLNFDSKRAYDVNGRGILMANNLSFNKLKYNDKGNIVEIIIELP